MERVKILLSVIMGFAGFLVILGGLYRMMISGDSVGGEMILGGVLIMVVAVGTDKIINCFFG